VYARRQNGANGGWIEGWRRVGKPFEGDAGVTNLTAAATSDGRLELSVNGVTPTREWLERLVQPDPNADFDPNAWVKVGRSGQRCQRRPRPRGSGGVGARPVRTALHDRADPGGGVRPAQTPSMR
jgi:hypothetical protein